MIDPMVKQGNLTMNIRQVFDDAIKSTTSAFLATEKKNNFPARNVNNSNLGGISQGTPLKFSEQRGNIETPTYQLVPNAKPSDVVKGLISGKYACSMSCQMVSQLIWYHAILLTLTSAEGLGENQGVAVFDKLLTEIFPFVLRDFDINAGLPLVPGAPFCASRGFYDKILLHPLIVFKSQKLTCADEFMIGDTVLFNNFADFSFIARQAKLINQKMANTNSRRISALYLGKNELGKETYYAFETLSDKNTQENIAQHLTDCFNSNTLLIKSKDQRDSKKLLNTNYFYQVHTHEHFNVDILDGLIHDTDKTLAQIKEMRDVVSNQIAKNNNIEDSTTIETLSSKQMTLNSNGVEFYKNKKYAHAAESFQLAAANLVRAFEKNKDTADLGKIGRDLSGIFYNLARSYELLEKPLMARYYFENAVSISINIGEKPSDKSIEGLERMNKVMSREGRSSSPTLKK
jgi:hypothetical protein